MRRNAESISANIRETHIATRTTHSRKKNIRSRSAWAAARSLQSKPKNISIFLSRMVFSFQWSLHVFHVDREEYKQKSEHTLSIQVSCQTNWYGFCLVSFCIRYPVCIFFLFCSFLVRNIRFAFQSAAVFLFIVQQR